MFILGIAAWVFIALCILCVIMLIAVETEKPWGAFGSLVAAGALVHFTGTFDMLNVLHDWKSLLMFVGFYIVAGVVWGACKWVFHTISWGNTQESLVQDARREFLQRLGLSGNEIPSNHKDAWTKWVKQTSYDHSWKATYEELQRPPSGYLSDPDDLHIRNNIGRLMIWCAYWPWSFIWTVLDDPLKAIFKFLVINVFGGLMQAFSNRATSRVEQEISR